MATRSRTYKTTDWKVWTYQPTPGVFRLDFSKWDDGSDWGLPTAGGMAEVTGKISEITINDGSRPSNGVDYSINPATAQIQLEYLTFDKSVMAEFYSGKRIAITLKHEETTYGEMIPYGRNTLFFEGVITDSSISVDPVSNISIVDIEAVDLLSVFSNLQLAVNKSFSSDKGVCISNAIADAQVAASPSNQDFMFIAYATTLDELASSFGTTGNETKTIGEWLTDFSISSVSPIINRWSFYSTSYGTPYYTRGFYCRTVTTAGTALYDIPKTMITGVVLGEDAPKKPNTFTISNTTGVIYQTGTSINNSMNGVNSTELTTDIPNSTQAQAIVNKINQYKSAFRPIQVSVIQARNNQTITFTDTYQTDSSTLPKMYLYPTNYLPNGKVGRFDLTSYGYTLDETKSFIVGQTHTLTPDTWVTTYELLKGI